MTTTDALLVAVVSKLLFVGIVGAVIVYAYNRMKAERGGQDQ